MDIDETMEKITKVMEILVKLALDRLKEAISKNEQNLSQAKRILASDKAWSN